MSRKLEIASCLIGLLSVFIVIYFLWTLERERIYFSLIGESEIQLKVHQKYKENGVRACYGNIISCKRLNVHQNGKVNSNKIGTYWITYELEYGHQKKTIYRKVEVVDRDKPTIEVEETLLSICPNGKEKQYTYRAFDHYDGDLTDKVKRKIEGQYVLFTVTDSSGNVGVKKVRYEKSDTVAPTMTMNGSETISLVVGMPYEESFVQAMDDCDGDLTNQVVTSGHVNVNQPGTYTLTYTVADKSGNTTSKTRTVKVIQNPKVVSGKKTVYLTFDDGPSVHTERLLNILAKYNVKATFFVTNLNPGYESSIKRAYREGHTIGLHSYTHQYQTVYASKEAYYQDLNLISNKVRDLIGVETKLIRFPGGSSNTVSRRVPGIMTLLSKDVEAKGYRYFDWNVSSGDAGATTSTAVVIQNVTRALRSDASIVLQHDNKGFSVDAVEGIIQYGLANGYTFLPLQMTSPTAHHGLNN